MAFTGMPLNWDVPGIANWARVEHVGMALLAYCLVRALRSRQPESALLGAFAVAMGVGWLCRTWSVGAGFHAACVFFLTHSLRWADSANPRDRILRNLIAGLWVIHAAIWTRSGLAESGFVAACALCAASAWVLYRWYLNFRAPVVIPIASAVTCMSGPMHWFVENSSLGLMALGGSLLLFGMGIAVALTRRKWARDFTKFYG